MGFLGKNKQLGLVLIGANNAAHDLREKVIPLVSNVIDLDKLVSCVGSDEQIQFLKDLEKNKPELITMLLDSPGECVDFFYTFQGSKDHCKAFLNDFLLSGADEKVVSCFIDNALKEEDFEFLLNILAYISEKHSQIVVDKLGGQENLLLLVKKVYTEYHLPSFKKIKLRNERTGFLNIFNQLFVQYGELNLFFLVSMDCETLDCLLASTDQQYIDYLINKLNYFIENKNIKLVTAIIESSKLTINDVLKKTENNPKNLMFILYSYDQLEEIIPIEDIKKLVGETADGTNTVAHQILNECKELYKTDKQLAMNILACINNYKRKGESYEAGCTFTALATFFGMSTSKEYWTDQRNDKDIAMYEACEFYDICLNTDFCNSSGNGSSFFNTTNNNGENNTQSNDSNYKGFSEPRSNAAQL